MPLFRSAFKNFPAFSRAALIAFSASLILLLALRIGGRDKRPGIFLLGDSCIGNYRLDPGGRMQDFLARLEPDMRVENLAEPGATPLDFFLQWSRGALVSGAPYAVVIAFEPGKFLDVTCPHRLDADGVNLRWIPWNRAGLELYRTLSPREKNVALVQEASLPFFALADAGRALWIRYVQWPWERSHMRTASADRRKRIEAKAAELGRNQEANPVPDEQAFEALPRARDAAFLIRSLREAGIETRVLLLPFGNPGLFQRTCSAKLLAKHDTLDVRMRHWLERKGVAYVDFNAPAERAHFPEPVWDDAMHLKDSAAFAYMALRAHESFAKASAWPGRAPLSVVQSAAPDAGLHGN